MVIAVTTRTIFNLEKEHEIFLTKGKEEYVKHQQANENSPLEQGTAFPFIQVKKIEGDGFLLASYLYYVHILSFTESSSIAHVLN